MSAAFDAPDTLRLSPPDLARSELLLGEPLPMPRPSTDIEGRCWLSMLLRPEVLFLRGGGTGGGGPADACDMRLLDEDGRSVIATSLSSSFCS